MASRPITFLDFCLALIVILLIIASFKGWGWA